MPASIAQMLAELEQRHHAVIWHLRQAISALRPPPHLCLPPPLLRGDLKRPQPTPGLLASDN